jgi:hypothetical protein
MLAMPLQRCDYPVWAAGLEVRARCKEGFRKVVKADQSLVCAQTGIERRDGRVVLHPGRSPCVVESDVGAIGTILGC